MLIKKHAYYKSIFFQYLFIVSLNVICGSFFPATFELY